jgi:hypothetical protein
MNFWIAYAIAFVAWWTLYFFVSDRMTDLGVGWINAMNPQSKAQSLLSPTLTLAKHIVFGVLMIAALVSLRGTIRRTATGRTGLDSFGMFATGS